VGYPPLNYDLLRTIHPIPTPTPAKTKKKKLKKKDTLNIEEKDYKNIGPSPGRTGSRNV
jgi:hypothetical protein